MQGWGRGGCEVTGLDEALNWQLFLDPTSLLLKMKEEEDNKLGSTVSLFGTYFQNLLTSPKEKPLENMKSAQTGGRQGVHKI